jgi:hypothetical protein
MSDERVIFGGRPDGLTYCATSEADYWRERAEAAEAKLAAAEDFTRQYADSIQSVAALPSDAPHKLGAALLTMAEPTHKLGGDKAL